MPARMREMVSKRVALPVLAGVTLLAGIVAASTAAAPIYTDWSAPVNIGAPVNTPGNVQALRFPRTA